MVNSMHWKNTRPVLRVSTGILPSFSLIILKFVKKWPVGPMKQLIELIS